MNETIGKFVEEAIEALSLTHKEHYAFMTMKNGKGEIEDWTIPFTEIVKILQALLLKAEIKK